MTIARALLEGIVDYAGTYPPASLSPSAAAAEYARARDSEHAWMLGRLVWPVARLDELSALARREVPVTAVVSSVDDIPGLRTVRGNVRIDMVEVKAANAGDLERIGWLLPHDLPAYIEVSAADDPSAMLRAVKTQGLRAKLRTGGVTAEAFPTAAQVLRFVQQCVELDVSLKATAGLHHPVRGEYPLTYEPGCPTGVMFGFLNLLLCVRALEGGAVDRALELLTSVDQQSLVAEASSLSSDDARSVRGRLHSFGSCSFREPVDDLMRLGAL